MSFNYTLLLLIMLFASSLSQEGLSAQAAEQADVIIYGGTSAAVTAAVQLRRSGKSVIVVSPDKHLGGLTSGGLGFTDTGDKRVIGGLAREFYQAIYNHYADSSAWRWQSRSEYGNVGQGTPAIDGERRTMYIFEPHAAEEVFDDWVEEHQVTVLREALLDRESGVSMEDGRIVAIRTLDGREFRGKYFIDATYEGDLMAAAGVSYTVGREANAKYGEEWNGVQTGVLHHSHHFSDRQLSPYRIPGEPESGLLWGVSAEDPGAYGEGDHRLQAYCFRTCLTREPANRVPFPRPEGYDSTRYDLLVRILDDGWRETFNKFDPIPNLKTDVNNHGPFSFDYIGANYDYPEAGYERRREIIEDHYTYQMGMLYFYANDPRVPQEIQDRMRQWGLSRDEFTDNGHWPHQIYVREARRMVGDYVMSERDVLAKRPVSRPIGMGSYVMDSHNVQRYVTAEGHVQNEGDIGAKPKKPYPIAYGAILPKREECTNLLVPVAVSSSHIAFGSIRMEPVFMVLGQSAALATILALEDGAPLQDLDYTRLTEELTRAGQVLEMKE